MTSLDDDGSTRREPQGQSQDHDEVRLTAPADPWLTEAPTSAISDATTLRDFNAAPGVTRVDAAAPSGGKYPWRRYGRRRRRRLVAAVLAACAVLVAAMLAFDPFGSGDDPEASKPEPSTGTTAAKTTTSARPAVNRPDKTAAAAAAAPTSGAPAADVVYEVTASGSRNTGSIVYTDQDGVIIRLHGVPLPWRTTFVAGERRKPLILDAQRKGGGDAGPVTCTITMDGKVLASTTADGEYASAMCTGSR